MPKAGPRPTMRRRPRRSSTDSARSSTTCSPSRARPPLGSSGVTVDLSEIVDDAVERWRGPAAEAEKTVRPDGRERACFADPARSRPCRRQPGRERPSLLAARRARRGRGRGRRTGARPLPSPTMGRGFPPRTGPACSSVSTVAEWAARRGPGQGSGLAIVAELVHRWGGEVSSPTARERGSRPLSGMRLPIAEPAFTVSEHGRCYGQ